MDSTYTSFPHHILMTADTVGGVWTYVVELAKALDFYNVNITLATMGERLTKAQAETVAKLPNVEVRESTFQLEWMNEPWEDVEKAGEWLLQLAEEVKPDLVHLNNYVHGNLPWKCPVLIVAHSCVLSWWQAVKGEKVPDYCGTYAERVSKGLYAAHMVVAPTQAMLNVLQENYGHLLHTKVIPNGLDINQFTIAPKEPFVLSMGRIWDEAKNIAILEKIANDISYPVYIAGENTHPNTNYIIDFPNINLLGKLSAGEVHSILSKASIFAMPAKYEPFGLSILEAGLSGCALVLGDIPSLRENWQDAALFVPPHDTQILKKMLLQLIEDIDLRQTLAQKAHQRAMQFTSEHSARMYYNLYASLLDNQAEVIYKKSA